MTATTLPETVLPGRAGNGTRTYLTEFVAGPVWVGGWLTSYGPRVKAAGVHRWYDPNTRSWVVYLVDEAGHQVGTSEYVGTAADAKAVVADFVAEALRGCAACGERLGAADRAETARGIIHAECIEDGEQLA